jgi:pimeloyl-ACP methyl ester carboxylesterase
MVVPGIVVGLLLAVLVALFAAAVVVVVVGGIVALLVGAAALHWRFTRAYRLEGEPSPLGGIGAVLLYQVREAWSAAILGAWYVRAAFRNALRSPEVPDGPPVLCVHGFTQNGTNLWGIRNALERRGRPTRAVSLGRPLQRIEGYAAPLARALADLVYEHPEEGVDVVAHSMGGVVLRIVLRDHPELARRVRRVVTLGSPHHGTQAARGTPLAGEVWQMRRGSVFLRDLPEFRTLAPAARVTTIAAEADYVVQPASTCHLDGARQVNLPGLGHVGLLTAPSALRAVVAAICEDEAGGELSPRAASGAARTPR